MGGDLGISSIVIATTLLTSPIAFPIALFWAWKERQAKKQLQIRLKSILDIEAEIEKLRFSKKKQVYEIESLRSQYQVKRGIYDKLIEQVAIFDEKISFSELGIYEPHFDFTDSEAYKREIGGIRDLQKRLVSSKNAVICTTNWSVDGSKSKGQTMTNRNIRLTLRAFNNECDAAIANTRWNNVNAMEKRIMRAREQIDGLNASNSTYITQEYLEMKLKELYLTHEHREKLKVEREERAEAARLAREEQKLLRDMENAQDEEKRYEKLLAKARAEASAVTGEQLAAFQEQIHILEQDLAEAHAKVERAQAMAERTRTGYVYIISNVGAFGEDIVKIGLTRRLDPSDRVRELGDASVPFTFDTHAIIYSDDAPALERALHSEFDYARVNTRNYRKEFFHVSLDAVEEAVERLAPSAAFFKDIDAQEYRETVAQRHAQLEQREVAENALFPQSI